MQRLLIGLLMVCMLYGCSMQHRHIPRRWGKTGKPVKAAVVKSNSKTDIPVIQLNDAVVLDDRWQKASIEDKEVVDYLPTLIDSESMVVSTDSLGPDSITTEDRTLSSENKIIFGAVVSVNLLAVLLPELGTAMQILLLFPLLVALGFLLIQFFKQLARNRFPRNPGMKNGYMLRDRARKVRNIGLGMWLASLVTGLLFLATFNLFTINFIFGVLAVTSFYLGLILLLVAMVMFFI